MVKIRQRTFDSTRVSYLLTHRIVAFAVVGAALTGCNTKPKVDSTVNGDSGRIRSVVVTQSKIPDSKTTPITAKSDAPQLTPLPLVPPSPVITSEIPALNASSDWQAGAKIEQLKSWAENHSKLFEAASALMLRNIEECPRATRKLLGFTAKNKYSYSSQYASAAEEGLGLSEQLQVMEVLPHSGAHDVGLKRGDLLLEFNGQPVPTGPNAEREAALAMGPEIRRTDRISLVIERHGERVSVDTPLTQACAFGLEYGDTDEINSYADGYRIMVTKGLLDFLESEEELSYVIAKEMAHNLLGHGDHGNMRKLIDQYRSIDPSIEPESHTAIRPYSASADILADKLALKLLHQSGFSVASYISFWQRMGEAAEQGKADTYKALHPFAHERIQALPKLISAITRKTPLRKEAGVAVLAGQR